MTSEVAGKNSCYVLNKVKTTKSTGPDVSSIIRHLMPLRLFAQLDSLWLTNIGIQLVTNFMTEPLLGKCSKPIVDEMNSLEQYQLHIEAAATRDSS